MPDDSFPVRRPPDVAAVCELVRDARAAGRGVYPAGGRTMTDLGHPPTKPGFTLDTTALNRVTEYPARDMTVTVQAGCTVAALRDTLAAEGQFLPIDVPHRDRATVGGIVAANVSGPRRFGYGTLRDYVIGIRFVSDDGVEVRGGGRVVKNVAGYDLMKLHTGALGTLGVVTEVTFKVRPKPEAVAAVTFGLNLADVGPILDRLHGSNSRPVAVALTNHVGPSAPAPWMVALGFEEKQTTVASQLEILKAELAGTPARGLTERHGADAESLWQTLADVQVRPESRVIWKFSVKPSQVAATLAGLGDRELVYAEPLNGVVWVHAAGGDPPAGRVVTRRGPAGADRMGLGAGPAADLMRHVKRTLDPDDVFNPGRLFG